MNTETMNIIQEILKKDNLQFTFFDSGSSSNYYLESSLNYGVKVFLEDFKPRRGIMDVTNRMNLLGISNKIYEVSEEFKFILMEHLNGYRKICDAKIIKFPSKRDKLFLKKVLKYWVIMSEIGVSHFDVYAQNVLINDSNDDVKLIDFDEYKIGNKYILMEYLQDDRFGNFLLHSLQKGESLEDFEDKHVAKLLEKREEIFKDLIVKDRVQLGNNTFKNKIENISQSTIDSVVKEILEDIKYYLSLF